MAIAGKGLGTSGVPLPKVFLEAECVFSILGQLAWAAQNPTAPVAEAYLGVDKPQFLSYQLCPRSLEKCGCQPSPQLLSQNPEGNMTPADSGQHGR